MIINQNHFTEEEGFLRNAEELNFDDTLCYILKELKFNYETEGVNSRKVLVCRIEDNIDMIKTYCKREKDAHIYFWMCFPAIAIITRKYDIPEDFITKYNIKPWHLSLIRRTYFNLSINKKERSYTNSESEITLDDKRPYGNSYILDDVSKEYLRFNQDETTIPDVHELKGIYTNSKCFDVKHNYLMNHSDFLWNIMDETNAYIKLMLKEIDYSDLRFIKDDKNTFIHYTNAWLLCTSVELKKKRNKKIDELIND